MKCIAIFFALLSSFPATTASPISDEFDKEAVQTHLRRANGVPVNSLVERVRIPGTQRGKDWLSSNQSYINASLQWNPDLKEKAEAYALEGVNDNCRFPDITLDRDVNGQLISGGKTKMSTLRSTEVIFQRLEKSTNVNLNTLANMKEVGCSDALKKSLSGVTGCSMSICLYSR